MKSEGTGTAHIVFNTSGSSVSPSPRQSAKGAAACGPSTRTVVTWPDGREIVVIIGTTDMARRDPTLIPRICYIVDEAYTAAGKRKRMDEYDAHHRLRMGDAGPGANRVLHMAYKGGMCEGSVLLVTS